jgi:hypothetical protein
MFVCLGLMIAIYGPNVHLIVMFSLGIGLVFSYFVFMSAVRFWAPFFPFNRFERF